MTTTSDGARAVRGAGATLIAQVIRFGLQIGALVVLARLLSPAEFGVVAMVTALTGIAEIVRDFGLSSAAMHAKQLTQAQRSALFWLNTAIGAGCAVLLAASAPLLALLYDDQRVVAITLALAWPLVVSGANTQLRADLARRSAFTALAVTDVAAQAAGIAVAVGLAWQGAGYWAIVGQQITVVLTAFVLNAWHCRWLPSRPSRHGDIKPLISYGANVFGTQLLGAATNNVDNVALGAVAGAGPLGLYTRAYQLLMVPLNQLNAPMTRVALPTLSKVADEPEVFSRYVLRSQLLGTHVLGVGFAVAAGLAWPLTAVLFGADWMGVAPIFAALAVGGVFRGLTQVPYWMFLAAGHAKAQFRLYLWTRPLIIATILAGLPWGPVGVAVGHTAAFAVYWLVSLHRAGQVCGVPVAPVRAAALWMIVTVMAPAGALAWGATHVAQAPSMQLLLGAGAAFGWLGIVVAASPRLRADLTLVAQARRR